MHKSEKIGTMKNVNYALALGLALCSLAAGCSKGLQHPTPLPGSRAGRIGEQTAPVLDSDMAGKIKDTGIEPTTKSFKDWPEDRNAFRDQVVYFDFDKSNIKPSEVSKLESVASQMKST